MDKKIIVEHLQKTLFGKMQELEKAIKNAQDSANSESKSSAGDKYETARAMAQNDILMYTTQLYEAQREKNILDKINVEQKVDLVKNGALVYTSIGIFFICISLGKTSIDNQNILFISQESPIAKQLIGLKKGDSFNFNSNKISILDVL